MATYPVVNSKNVLYFLLEIYMLEMEFRLVACRDFHESNRFHLKMRIGDVIDMEIIYDECSAGSISRVFFCFSAT